MQLLRHEIFDIICRRPYCLLVLRKKSVRKDSVSFGLCTGFEQLSSIIMVVCLPCHRPKTEPESKIEEGQASGEGAGEEGKDGESKPEGKTSSTSTRKKKWLPWQRREGNSVKGASLGAEPANSSGNCIPLILLFSLFSL